ncbi:methyl-galactoside transport system substrate-binding protein [Lachnospiraceae bacterium XBB2008]|nr:methyl-galactoside transport system substrate-binding protein [Lachnospiraceae bacterium XBB2008]
MKKTRHCCSLLLISLMIVLSAASACLGGCGTPAQPAVREVKIAVLTYDDYDTFVNSVTRHMTRWCRQKEKEDDVRITIDIVGAKKSQLTQNDQARNYIQDNYDVLCVNLVDRTDASGIIDKAVASGTPVIFFNREPVSEDLYRWDQLYYVGAIPSQSGELQARIITDALSDPDKFDGIDVNDNGTIQYVMLEGEAGHQDSLVRTSVCTNSIVNAGFSLEKLGDEYANWDRDQARAKMKELIDRYPFQIEMVIANNDDMALGALDALTECDYPLDPFVVGINGTPEALEAVRTMKMDGSVYNDAKSQGETIMEMAYALGQGLPVPDTVELTFDKYVFTPYSIITYDNVQEYLNNEND